MKISLRERIRDSWNYLTRSSKQARPSEWDDFWYEAQKFANSSGMDVTEDTAMTFFAVWACVKVVSEDLASLPLFVYRRDGKNKEPAIDHPAYKLLHDSPNPEMSAIQWREAAQAHLMLWGNHYSMIQQNLRGDPLAIWPLNPANMEVSRTDNNELIYKYRLTKTGETEYFSKEEILHIAGLGFNGLVGYSPIKYHAETIGTGMAEQQYQSSTFGSGGRLSVVFVHPGHPHKTPNKEARDDFVARLRKEYGGPQGQRIGVTWEGMKPEKISMTPEDAQFIESRKLTWVQACAIYRVQPHKVMNLFNATFSNIENQDIDYVKSSIRPWAVRWEQAINMKLLQSSEQYFAEHKLDGLMRGDIASRYNAYAIGRQWGWLSPNDIRALENMNPIKNGDEYLTPMNMMPLGSSGDESISDEEKEQAARAIRHLRLIGGK